MDSAASHVWLPEGNYSKTHPALILHVKGSSAGGRQPKLLAQKSACVPLQIPQMVKGFPSIEAKLIFFQTPLLPQMIKGAGHRGKIYFQTKTPGVHDFCWEHCWIHAPRVLDRNTHALFWGKQLNNYHLDTAKQLPAPLPQYPIWSLNMCALSPVPFWIGNMW